MALNRIHTPAPRTHSARISQRRSLASSQHGRAARSNSQQPSASRSGTRAAPDPKIAWEIGVLLGRARRLIFNEFERELDPRGESLQAWRALSQLQRLGAVAQCELARALAQHPAGISRLLDELEEGGLVKRRRDGIDRRRIWVELTPQGHLRYARLRPIITRVLRGVFGSLTPADCRLLQRLLGTIVGPNAHA